MDSSRSNRASCKTPRTRKIDDFDAICQNPQAGSSGGGGDILEKVDEPPTGQGASKGRFCAARSFATGSNRPEEIVRQHLLQQMVQVLKYPKHLIAVEKELKELPHLVGKPAIPKRRVDLICFAKDIHPDFSLFPLLLIECKADKADEAALQQVLGYNHYVQARYVAVVSRRECLFAYPSGTEYKFLSYLPPFDQLMVKR